MLDNELKISFLDNVLSITTKEALETFVIEFLIQSLKLSSVMFETKETIPNLSKDRFEATQNAINARLKEQVKSMHSAVLIKNVGADILVKDIPLVDQVPKSVLCLPLEYKKELLGFLLCYADKDISSQLEFFMWVANKLSIALNRILTYTEIKQSALRDALTGVHNRIYFEAIARNELLRTKQQKLPLSIFMIDIDDFKQFNDTQGHVAGDAILVSVAQVLEKGMLHQGTVCRFGGEEFIVLVPEKNGEATRSLAESLRIMVAESGVSVSIGIGTCLNSSVEMDVLIKEADAALYKAKSLGKNRTCQRIIVDKSLSTIDVEDASSVGKTT